MDISDFDREMSAFLAQGQVRITPAIKPHWLLDDFAAPVWRVKTSQSRQVKGQWKGTLNLYWGRPIAGTDRRLTDPEFALLLEHLKLLTIAAKESPAADVGIEQAYRATRTWLLLADWLVLHRESQVKAFGLNALDCDAIEKFLLDVFEYGAGAADWITILENYLVDRFLDAAERARLSDWERQQSKELLDRLDRPADATHDERLPEWLCWTRRWLHMQGWIKCDGRLDIKPVSDILHIDCGRLSNSESFLYYLRQFEDTLDYARFEGLGLREKMGHKHRTVQEAALSPASGHSMFVFFAHFLLLIRCAPYCEGIEDHFNLSVERLLDAVPAYLKGNQDKRTRSMSVDTALHIYKHLIHWALQYSKPLMTYYIQLIQYVQANHGTVKKLPFQSHGNAENNWWEDAFKAVPVPKELSSLNIVQFYSIKPKDCGYLPDGGHPLPAILRQRMGLEDAMLLNDAVQILLTSAFTARRYSELCRLLRSCLSFIPGRGAFIDFGLAKVTKEGIRSEQLRPIPTMLYETLRAQTAFANALTAAYPSDDDYLKELLFVYPPMHHAQDSVVSSENALSERLDLFCDFIEVPLDENGRRWYIRTHEARRFFALAFFWLFEGASLTALSWFLGHKDIRETWRYIKSEMTGEEISQADAMIALKAMKSDADYSGVDKLREIVYRHFGINSLELIKPEDLEAYLEDLREGGIFSVQPYSIEDDDGNQFELVIEVYKEDAA